MRRRWVALFAGHIPVITNGWSLARVAAYERRHFFHVHQASLL